MLWVYQYLVCEHASGPRYFFINRQAGATGVKTIIPVKRALLLLLLWICIACKKSSQSPQSPTTSTLLLVTNGFGHTNNSGLIVSMNISNQAGTTIFHKDTLSFSIDPITYKITVKSGDVLKAVWNSNITNAQALAPVVDMSFHYGNTTLSDIDGGIYNTQTYYNGSATANTTTITIP